jgi:hypothetical protein
LEQENLGMLSYFNRTPPSKAYANVVLPNANHPAWPSYDKFVEQGKNAQTTTNQAQLRTSLSAVGNIRACLLNIHERIPRVALKDWWCLSSHGQEWVRRTQQARTVQEVLPPY